MKTLRVLSVVCALALAVTNAGGLGSLPAATLSPNGFKTVLEIDAMGTFNVTRAAFDDFAALDRFADKPRRKPIASRMCGA